MSPLQLGVEEAAGLQHHHHRQVVRQDLLPVRAAQALEVRQAASEPPGPLRHQVLQLLLARLVQVGPEGDHPDDLPDEGGVHVVDLALLPVVGGLDEAVHHPQLVPRQGDLPAGGAGAALLPPPLLPPAAVRA